VSEKLAQAGEVLNDGSTRFFPDRVGKRGSPVVQQPKNSTGDHGTASVMAAWTAGIQARRDASGDIHVNLRFGSPCRNDDIKEKFAKVDQT
jgi:hypothetical protein